MEKKEKDNEYVDFVVEAGQLLLIHQAMKMYNRVVAPVAGTIVELGVTEGDKIPKDHLMVKIQPK